MELWDILDEAGNRTGKTAIRGEGLKPGEYHLVVTVLIVNALGEYLIAKRAKGKTWPDKWEITSGSVIQGEDSREGALREVKEELGIDLKTEGILFKRQVRNLPDAQDINDIWVYFEDVKLTDLKLQEEEVADAVYLTEREVLSLYQEGQFVSLFTYLPDLFAFVHKVKK